MKKDLENIKLLAKELHSSLDYVEKYFERSVRLYELRKKYDPKLYNKSFFHLKDRTIYTFSNIFDNSKYEFVVQCDVYGRMIGNYVYPDTEHILLDTVIELIDEKTLVPIDMSSSAVEEFIKKSSDKYYHKKSEMDRVFHNIVIEELYTLTGCNDLMINDVMDIKSRDSVYSLDRILTNLFVLGHITSEQKSEIVEHFPPNIRSMLSR